MPKLSAGMLMYQVIDDAVQVLLVHPGGPYFRNKDDGGWSIPKGEIEPDEDTFEAAKREFQEELGMAATGAFIPLSPVKQKGGKIILAWAFEGEWDTTAVRRNTFTIEWPPKSGRQVEFPEIDRAEFFDLDSARRKINAGQVGLLDELETILTAS